CASYRRAKMGRPAADQRSTPPRRRGVQPLEQRHALGEHLMVVRRGRKQRADRHVDAARLLVWELAVPQIRLVHDFSEAREAAISQLSTLDQRLERAVLAVMAELDAGGVEGDGVLWKLRRRREDEHRGGIDEALDEPRGRDPIDVGSRAGDPTLAAELGE